jgi:hypothetical protein
MLCKPFGAVDEERRTESRQEMRFGKAEAEEILQHAPLTPPQTCLLKTEKEPQAKYLQQYCCLLRP